MYPLSLTLSGFLSYKVEREDDNVAWMDFSALNSELSEVWVPTLTGQGSLCRFNICIELACMTRRCHMVQDQPNWAAHNH